MLEYAENDNLRLLIQRLLRHRFGRRSEQLSPDQLQLGIEDLEQSVAENQAAQGASEEQKGRRPTPPRRNHGTLPQHLPRYEVLEPEYSLLSRGFEQDQADYCREQGVGVITYWALAGGFLTGKYRSKEDMAGKARARNVAQHLTARGFKVLDAVEAVAGRHAVAPAQVALAWLLRQDGIIAIPKAGTVAHVQDNRAALDVRLTADDLAALDRAFPPPTRATPLEML